MKIFKFYLDGQLCGIRAEDKDVFEVLLLKNGIEPNKVSNVACEYLDKFQELYQLEMETHTILFENKTLEEKIKHYKRIELLKRRL